MIHRPLRCPPALCLLGGAPVWVVIVLNMLLCMAAGCMDGYKTTDRDIQQIQYTRLVEMLEDAEGGYTVIVDVRSASKFVQDHIPGAIHIPFPQLKANDARLSDADHIVVYGDGREDYLSPAAAKRLLNLGYGHVLDFRDGLVMWNNHRQPSP